MRSVLLNDARAHDAILVCTLAYAGLRPEEALALRWEDIGEQTINVQRAVVLGRAKPTKTRRARHVDLLPALHADLHAVRDLTDAKPRDLLWSYKRGLWADHHYRNWRSRVYKPLALQAGLIDTRPYTLRHSFASLLIASGRTLVEVAAQLGHGTDVCSRTYARAFAEYRGRSIDIDAELATHRSHPLGDYFDEAPVCAHAVTKLAEANA
jgi:integrase